MLSECLEYNDCGCLFLKKYRQYGGNELPRQRRSVFFECSCCDIEKLILDVPNLTVHNDVNLPLKIQCPVYRSCCSCCPPEREADTQPRHVPCGDDDPHTVHHDPSVDLSITGMYI